MSNEKGTEWNGVNLVVNKQFFMECMNSICDALVNDKDVLKEYIVPPNLIFNGNTVNSFFQKIKEGKRHKSRAQVYDNIDICMRYTVFTQLRRFLSMKEVLNSGMITLNTENLPINKVRVLAKFIEEQFCNEFEYSKFLGEYAFILTYKNAYVAEKIDYAFSICQIAGHVSESIRIVSAQYRNLFQQERFKQEAFNALEQLTNQRFEKFLERTFKVA